MKNWIEKENWTKDEFINVVSNYFKKADATHMYLDEEHSDSKNISDILTWAKENGYNVEEYPSDESVKIWLADNPVDTVNKKEEKSQMITKEMVRAGYEDGLVSLIKSPNGDGLAARIGDEWIYFGGETAEGYDCVERYKADIPEDSIITDIYNVLESFRIDGQYDPCFGDEYDYYAALFAEHEASKNAKSCDADAVNELPAESLTAGLLRELIKGRNIPALEALISGKGDNTFLDLVDRNDYIATKLWSREDVEGRLKDLGFPSSPSYVDEVLNYGTLKQLAECTDSDWYVLDEAIYEAASQYALPDEVKLSGPFSVNEIIEFPFRFENELPMTVVETISKMDMSFDEGELYVASATHSFKGSLSSKTMLYAIRYIGDSCWKPVKVKDNTIYHHFADDKEKMVDFFDLTKEEFLRSYSYLTKKEYELTKEYVEENHYTHYFECVEMCSDCMTENTYPMWDVKKQGYVAVCKNCGREIMLCDECFHNEDNPEERCDWEKTEAGGKCFRGCTAPYRREE